MEHNLLFPSFEGFSNVFISMSLREDKNMKIPDDYIGRQKVLANREKYLKKLNIPADKLVSAGSVHGNNIRIVTDRNAGSVIADTDGLITCRKGVFLSITVADCLPVIIYDSQKEILSLLHCGWRGLEKNIILKTVEELIKNFGVNLKDLFTGIGPGLCTSHFEVGKDLADKFHLYSRAIILEGNKSFIDLKSIARMQMENAGIETGNIGISPICTYCQSGRYFSFRKDRTQPVQAMMVIAGLPDF